MEMCMRLLTTAFAALMAALACISAAAAAAEGKTKAQVAAVTGLAQQIHGGVRMDAFKSVLAQHPGIELVAVEDGKWNTALSEKITGELLVRFSGRGGIDGVFAMADNQ